MSNDGLSIMQGRGQVGVWQAVRISFGRALASRQQLFITLAWGFGVAAINIIADPPQGKILGAAFSILFAFSIGYLAPIPWRIRLHRARRVSFIRILLLNGILSLAFGCACGFFLLMLSGLIGWNGNFLSRQAFGFYAQNALWGFIFAPVGLGIVMGEEGERQKRRAAHRTKRLERLAEESRIVALRAQINPHFFFNALNTIAALIPDRPADAEHAVLLLADALRPVLTREQPLTAPLSQELSIARAYIQIEQLRMGDRLEFVVKAPDEFMAMTLPSLSIQPLVENAVRHGAAKTTGPFRIIVDARHVGSKSVVEVRSSPADAPPMDFDAMTPVVKTPGHALHNIETRLIAHFGVGAKLDVRTAGTSAIALLMVEAASRRLTGQNMDVR